MTKLGLLTGVAMIAAVAFAPRDAAAALDVTATNDVATLTGALLAANSGITLLSSELTRGAANQQGTYTGFNLAPSTGSTPTLSQADGIVLSTGVAVVATTNTTNSWAVSSGSGSYAPLTALAGTNTNDANVLTYTFTLDNPTQNAITAQFVFGTEEFPTQSVTDIFGFFVDGVNYAKFPNGDLIQNTPGNPTNFIHNPVGEGLYGIEWNGLTRVFTVTGLLDPTKTVHTLSIAIADTSDSIYDSAVYLSGLAGTTTTGGGGIDPNPVPEPATLALLGMGLLGLGAARRARSAR